jgi:hypothetical protein
MFHALHVVHRKERAETTIVKCYHPRAGVHVIVDGPEGQRQDRLGVTWDTGHGVVGCAVRGRCGFSVHLGGLPMRTSPDTDESTISGSVWGGVPIDTSAR